MVEKISSNKNLSPANLKTLRLNEVHPSRRRINLGLRRIKARVKVEVKAQIFVRIKKLSKTYIQERTNDRIILNH